MYLASTDTSYPASIFFFPAATAAVSSSLGWPVSTDSFSNTPRISYRTASLSDKLFYLQAVIITYFSATKLENFSFELVSFSRWGMQNAESLDRWGGKTKDRLISYFLSNTSAKKYYNRIVYVKSIASQV